MFIGSRAFFSDILKYIILEYQNNLCNGSRGHTKSFPIEDMSNWGTVAKYFTDTYRSVAWRKLIIL